MVTRNSPPTVFQKCPVQQVLDRIANKWVAIIVYALSNGTKRFSELQREIDGVSQKMLTQTLRNLEHDGLVERKVYPSVPPKVEYSLTPLGQTLTGPLGAICKWAQEHLPELEAARARHHSNGAASSRQNPAS